MSGIIVTPVAPDHAAAVNHRGGGPAVAAPLLARLKGFQLATGIALRLTTHPADPGEYGQAEHGACAVLNPAGAACTVCRDTHGRLRSSAGCGGGVVRETCHLGMVSFVRAIPLDGGRLGFIEGGRLALRQHGAKSAQRMTGHLRSLGLDAHGIAGVKKALGRTTVMDGGRLAAALDLLECLCRELENKGSGPTPHAPPEHPLICKARDFISARLTEKLTVRCLAIHVHVSEDHFSRLFKSATGETFTAYLQRLRLGRACRLLRETNHPVTEVAFESGFESVPHFNRLFRRAMGCTPREFRRKGTQNHASQAALDDMVSVRCQWCG